MTPYAMFRFHGEVVSLTREQFEQALRDGRRCRCGDCLACRAVEYKRDAEHEQRMRERHRRQVREEYGTK